MALKRRSTTIVLPAAKATSVKDVVADGPKAVPFKAQVRKPDTTERSCKSALKGLGFSRAACAKVESGLEPLREVPHSTALYLRTNSFFTLRNISW